MKYWKRIAAFLTAGALVLGLAAFGSAETAKASEAEDAGETADEASMTDEADYDFDDWTIITNEGIADQDVDFYLLPDAYNEYDTEHKGTDVVIHYTTDVYGDGVTYDKFCRVYLPYGYDPDDTETKYNVIYFQHGNAGSPNELFDHDMQSLHAMNLLNNIFDPDHQLMEPCIIVCPTYYLEYDEDSYITPGDNPAGDGGYEGIENYYYLEVVQDLIPAVESQFNVYCEDFSPEGIAATRDHRAWAGYSRGSMCTWYMFNHDLEYFEYFIPMSAPIMTDGPIDDKEVLSNEEAYDYLKEAVDEHPDLDFFIFATAGGTGDAYGDISLGNSMQEQINYLASQTDTFSFGLNPEENNLYFTRSEFFHNDLYMPYSLVNAAQVLFKDDPEGDVAAAEDVAAEDAAAEDAAPDDTAEEAAETAEDAGTVKQDIVEYFWEIPEDASLEEAMQLENRNFRIARSLEPLYDADTYDAYKTAVSNMQRYGDQESYDAAVEARENLIQTSSMEDRVWFLWDDEGPVMDGESFTEEELDASQEDAYGYQPFIIKYLLDDPSEAKGNIVAVSGGGFTGRSNRSEGYPAAEVFNDLGYNVFLVQRRVDPYSPMDIYMDYQRAVRMVRYYAEQEGYGGTDMIAGVGWSGGGHTIIGAIDYCYGNLTPADEGASGYVPDEIDAVNSDLDVAMIIYGTTGEDLLTDNTNWPAFYICAGTEDEMVDPAGAEALYDQVKDKVPAMLHMMEGAGHSFGVGISPGVNLTDECALWPAEADEFMQENLGHSGNAAAASDGSDETVNEASADEVSADEVLAYLKEKYDEMEISYYSEDWAYEVDDDITKYRGTFFSEGFYDIDDPWQMVADAEEELKEDAEEHFGLGEDTFTVNIMILTDDGYIYN